MPEWKENTVIRIYLYSTKQQQQMAKTAKSSKPAFSLNVQYNYITLRLPYGTFTTGRSGERATGMVAGKIFDSFVSFVDAGLKNKQTYGQIMDSLANEQTLNKIWPEWNKPLSVGYGVGDTVKYLNDSKRKPYGLGIVIEMKKGNAKVRFPGICILSAGVDSFAFVSKPKI